MHLNYCLNSERICGVLLMLLQVEATIHNNSKVTLPSDIEIRAPLGTLGPLLATRTSVLSVVSATCQIVAPQLVV